MTQRASMPQADRQHDVRFRLYWFCRRGADVLLGDETGTIKFRAAPGQWVQQAGSRHSHC